MPTMARQNKPVKPDPDNPWPALLSEARLRLGLTQPQAAERIGASLRSYISWERGETTPNRFVRATLDKFIKSRR